jgi:hypothetical protein
MEVEISRVLKPEIQGKAKKLFKLWLMNHPKDQHNLFVQIIICDYVGKKYDKFRYIHYLLPLLTEATKSKLLKMKQKLSNKFDQYSLRL